MQETAFSNLPPPLRLRVFLGSPSDVNDERRLALRVLDRLPYDPLLRGRVSFEAVAWDHPAGGAPMLAGISAQDSVIRSLCKPSDCDIVVICLWSRLGSPIEQPAYARPDGVYFTGTEWEYENARQAFVASGGKKPVVLLYRRTDEPVCKLIPTERKSIEERLDGMEKVDAFLQFCRSRDGSIANDYEGPSAFEEALEQHLKEIVRQYLDLTSASASTSVPANAPATPPLWPGSPFPGLRAFTERDWPIFFGRGRETDELVARLRDPRQRFIAVVGASGSGKSSLVWAGLIPRLVEGASEGGKDWAWVRFTPGELGNNPFTALASCWKEALPQGGQSVRDLAESLEHAPGQLDDLLRIALDGLSPTAELLIFIDQFEELFTVVDKRYRRAFVDFIQAADGSGRVRMVASMRADFYAACVERGLAELLRVGSYPLAAPGPASLHQMVVQPAARGGLEFEQGLVDEILRDAGGEPSALPLMAFALEQLYRARTPSGLLTREAYHAFGGVQGAIGKRADAVFDRLGAEVQARFTGVFRELVEVNERGVPTRRRTLLRETAHSLEARSLVDALTNARLLVTDGGDDDATVEVAHEALFRSWPRLADWVVRTTDDHRLRRQIAQLAAYWDAHGRQDEHRWPDERVVEVTEMMQHLGLPFKQLSTREQKFLGPLDPALMLQELDEPATGHERRAMIGVRLSLLGDPRPGVGLGADGLPDIDWVEIPGGEVAIEIREDANDPDSAVASTLTRQVEPFCIARYPVTVAQYQAFVRACHVDGRWRLPPDAPFSLPDTYPPPRHRARHGNHPADSVNWWDAASFCHWLGGCLGYTVRLPTEFEWQWAAIGGNVDFLYPWGPDWDPGQEPWRANTSESDLGRSTAVGMYPGGVSSRSVFDLSGTLWEWCENAFENPDNVAVPSGSKDSRVLRGGSWYDLAWDCRASYRLNDSPVNRNNLIGFRVCRSVPIE